VREAGEITPVGIDQIVHCAHRPVVAVENLIDVLLNTCPAGVRRSARPTRWNTAAPSSWSILASTRDNPGCEMCARDSVSVTVALSATALKPAQHLQIDDFHVRKTWRQGFLGVDACPLTDGSWKHKPNSGRTGTFSCRTRRTITSFAALLAAWARGGYRLSSCSAAWDFVLACRRCRGCGGGTRPSGSPRRPGAWPGLRARSQPPALRFGRRAQPAIPDGETPPEPAHAPRGRIRSGAG
jgi:hypothetical protein